MKKLIIIICALTITTASLSQDTTQSPPKRRLSPEQIETNRSIMYILKSYPNDMREFKEYFARVSKSNELITGSNQRLWRIIQRIDSNQQILIDRAEDFEQRALKAEAQKKIAEEHAARLVLAEKAKKEFNDKVVFGCLAGIGFFTILTFIVQIFFYRSKK